MNFLRLFEIAFPYRYRLIFLLSVMLAEASSILAVPWFAGKIFGNLEGQAGVLNNHLVVLIIGLIGIHCGLKIIRGRVLAVTSENILADLKTGTYNHLQLLPIEYFKARRQGELLALITYEVALLSGFITSTVLSLLPTLLICIGSIVIMSLINPILVIPIAVGIPAFYVGMKLLGRRLRPLAAGVREAYASSIAVADENLSMVATLKSFVREEQEAKRYERSVNLLRERSIEIASIKAVVGPTVHFIAGCSVVLVIWAGASAVLTGDMSTAQLIAFLMYAILLTGPLGSLADAWGQAQHARGALNHLDEVINSAAEPYESGAVPGPISGGIEFEKVSFTYSGRDITIDDLSLSINAGETIALTGVNGSGKSTLVDLLFRFYCPDAGRILLDGVDIASIKLNKLRRSIAVVPQHPLLLNSTVRDNIRYGRPQATDEDVADAAKMAQAFDFISQLPDGFETQVGDKGVRLSGGQRQRIALARALLKNSAILILDEPTAMFDPEGERRLVREIKRAFANRTVILITHRPASLALADRVVVLDQGRIIDDSAQSRATG
jgi:ATP-binding cassette, subfamily B, bacterial